MCALSEFLCSPDYGATRAAQAGGMAESQDLFGSTYACLVFRDGSADGLWPYGWATLWLTCRTYRERFPGAVECLDDLWRPWP